MKARRRFSNVVGFDDAPFARSHRGDVKVVGAVYAGLRLDGILVGRVRRDGANAANDSAVKHGPQPFHYLLFRTTHLCGHMPIGLGNQGQTSLGCHDNAPVQVIQWLT